MFTDIEGSTRLYQQLQEGFREVVADHNRLLSQAVTSHRGVVVKTLGDGVFAAFSEPRDGVAAAAAIQRAVSRHAWPGSAGLRVRIGLHCGAAQPEGHDYIALAVHQAARVAAAAHGGQVLVTAEMARRTDVAHGGLALHRHGRFRLKDFNDPVELFAVVGDEFPPGLPPRALPALAHNVPLQRTSFIGREAELAGLSDLLGAPALVSLVGPGGVGKTRLALELVRRITDRYADGARVIPLAHISSSYQVADAMLSGLGLREEPGHPADRVLLDHLERREMLLVLDNCEHLGRSIAELVDTLLASCPSLFVLATSREPLQLDGERVWRVQSLPGASPTAFGAAEELFVDRAAAAGLKLDVETAATRRQITAICAALDRLPLAMELAAARLRHMSLDELLAQVRGSLAVLRNRNALAADRHRTLFATIEWSYRLLNEETKRLFRQLSVFRGTFSPEAAAEVCADAGSGREIHEALVDLAEKSLLASEVGEATRYRMLWTVRQFTAAQLAESRAELQRTRQRHVAWATREAGGIAEALGGGDVERHLDRYERDYASLVAALEAAAEEALPESLTEIALGLYTFWWIRGRLSEGRYWLKVAGSAHAATPKCALARCYAGWFAYFSGDVEQGRRECEAAMTQLEVAGDEEAIALGGAWYGNLLAFTGALTTPSDGSRASRHFLTPAGPRTASTAWASSPTFATTTTGPSATTRAPWSCTAPSTTSAAR